jgi:ribulose-5-phosphate 4-epimerase/fuculose-1-phosphate aldolase
VTVTREPAPKDVKPGGRERWSPSILPRERIELSDRQGLACAFRILAGGGFSENIAGHITMLRGNGPEMYVNPWGLWWEEVTASDICVVDDNGRVVDGRWDVTPAIHIHTELHRRRPDAKVVIHNHPYYVTVLAAVGILPQILHQTGSLFDDDLVFVHEYSGEIDEAEAGADLAARIGTAPVSVLASHGVIVTGENLPQAVYRAASIDRMCRLTYDVLNLGREPLQIDRALRVGMKKSLLERAADVFWDGEVRALLRRDSTVLS